MSERRRFWAAVALGGICFVVWAISVEVRLVRREGIARAAGALERAAEGLKTAPGPLRPAPAEAERPRPAPPPPEGVRLRDGFENGTDGWFIARFGENVIGELRRSEDAKEGKGALELSYELEEGKVPVAARVTPRLRWTDRIGFWVKTTEQPCELLVGVSEKDDSSYQTSFHIEVGEGWKKLSVSLADLMLGDDSVDENGRLDAAQIQSAYIIDAGGFFGRKGENRLLIDEFVCERVAEAPAARAEEF